MFMILTTSINILPIINPDWDASIILGISTTFCLLHMVNQDF